MEERLLGGTTARRGEAVFVSGEGCWLTDDEGQRYLDLSSAQGVAMLGHCHPAISEAIARQAHTLALCPNYLYNDVRARFAEALAGVLPPHLPHAFLCNSGAEAVDGALKFARLATGRSAFVATTRGFHGRTFGALSVTWEPKYREGFGPLLETTHVPFNDAAALDAAVTDQTAAVILEVVQGESGVNLAEPAFLAAAERVCRDRGALLIVDEIQTGFGRTGRWFAIEHANLTPDIVCLAKGLGGGFPMGAFAYTARVRDALHQGAHGSTFGGSPLACAAGLAAIETYRGERLIERSATLGDADARGPAGGPRRGPDRARGARPRPDAGDRAPHEGGADPQEPDARSPRHRVAGRSRRSSACCRRWSSPKTRSRSEWGRSSPR